MRLPVHVQTVYIFGLWWSSPWQKQTVKNKRSCCRSEMQLFFTITGLPGAKPCPMKTIPILSQDRALNNLLTPTRHCHFKNTMQRKFLMVNKILENSNGIYHSVDMWSKNLRETSSLKRLFISLQFSDFTWKQLFKGEG